MYRHLIGLACVLGALALPPSVAQAAFPGKNGLIAFTGTDPTCCSDIYTINEDQSALTRVTHVGDGAAWSADGEKIAFASNRTGSFEIYTMNFDGTDQQVTDDPGGFDTDPAWSPDGTEIAFTRQVSGFNQIVRRDLTSGAETPVTTYPADNILPAWSPDGTTIAFTSYRNIRAQVFVIDVQSRVETPLTDPQVESESPSWSPDGKQIAFATSRDGNEEIYVMDGIGPTPGANQHDITNSTTADFAPAWPASGAERCNP